MRGSKAVEKVQEWHARFERCRMSDGRKVVRLLNRRGAEHREPGWAARHDVGMVAKDRQRMSGDGPRGHVHGEGG